MFISLPIKVRHLTLFSLCLMGFILYMIDPMKKLQEPEAAPISAIGKLSFVK